MTDRHHNPEKQLVLVFAAGRWYIGSKRLYTYKTIYEPITERGLIRSLIGVAILANKVKLHYFSEKTYEEISEVTRLSLLNRMAACF